MIVVVAELILSQKSPIPQSYPWNLFYGFAAVLHWYPDGIISMGFQQFFIGTLNNFLNQKKELHSQETSRKQNFAQMEKKWT